MQQIQYIKTNQLHESSMNPRKEFDHAGIEELAESIKQVGILQPIIARQNLNVKKKTIPIYEVICGSRRLSAAVIADLKEVPVIVRELSDEEAFDLMITENLQRKDVSPLEEANAYQSLILKGKYDANSLAERFGKSVTYIRQRIKLNDLFQEFKELLRQDVITVSHAFEIIKLETKYQQELFEEEFKDRREYWYCPTIKQLKNKIERNFTLKLSEASFNLLDSTLDKKAGPCSDCPKNTGSIANLFPDESGLCLDRSCFKHKSDIHFDRELKRIQEAEPDIILGIPSYNYGEDEKRAAQLKKSGIPLVEMSWQNGFQKVSEPLQPEQPTRVDYEDEEDFKEALADYEGELIDYQSDLEEYNAKIASGTLRKVFMTVGNDTGKTVLYEIRKDKDDRLGVNGKEIGNKELIKELQEKDKRNAEIAFEKTYLGVKDLIKENIYSNLDRELSPIEWQAIYILLLDFIGYVPLRDELNGSGRGYIDNKEKAIIASKLDINQINRLFRAFLQNRLDTSSPNYQISEAKVLIEIATECYPDQVKEIELKHHGTYLKRKEGIEKRISELNNQ